MQLFDWDTYNIGHLYERHNLSPEEVEQVMENYPFEKARYFRNGEERLNLVGETDAGLVLVVVTTMRQGRIRVVTAHPADRAQRSEYVELRNEQYVNDSEYPGLPK